MRRTSSWLAQVGLWLVLTVATLLVILVMQHKWCFWTAVDTLWPAVTLPGGAMAFVARAHAFQRVYCLWLAFLVLLPVWVWLLLAVFRELGLNAASESLRNRRMMERLRPLIERRLAPGERIGLAVAGRPTNWDSAAPLAAAMAYLACLLLAVPTAICLAMGIVFAGVPCAAVTCQTWLCYGLAAALVLLVAVRVWCRGSAANLGVSLFLAWATLAFTLPLPAPWRSVTADPQSGVDELGLGLNYSAMTSWQQCFGDESPAPCFWAQRHFDRPLPSPAGWFWLALLLWDLGCWWLVHRDRLLVLTDRRLLILGGNLLALRRGRWRTLLDTAEVTLRPMRRCVGRDVRIESDGFSESVHFLSRREAALFCELAAVCSDTRVAPPAPAPRAPFQAVALLLAFALALAAVWIHQRTFREQILDAGLSAGFAEYLTPGRREPAAPGALLSAADEVLAVKPALPLALALRADALRCLGRSDEAERGFHQALDALSALPGDSGRRLRDYCLAGLDALGASPWPTRGDQPGVTVSRPSPARRGSPPP